MERGSILLERRPSFGGNCVSTSNPASDKIVGAISLLLYQRSRPQKTYHEKAVSRHKCQNMDARNEPISVTRRKAGTRKVIMPDAVLAVIVRPKSLGKGHQSERLGTTGKRLCRYSARCMRCIDAIRTEPARKTC